MGGFPPFDIPCVIPSAIRSPGIPISTGSSASANGCMDDLGEAFSLTSSGGRRPEKLILILRSFCCSVAKCSIMS